MLTPYLRSRLKRPVGSLYRADQLRTRAFLGTLRKSPLVIAVGDRVTESLQELGRTPDVQVIDETEGRTRRQPPEVPYVRLVQARNPAGSITREAVEAIRLAMGGQKPVRVRIDGEEDLLTIPAIEAAPYGSAVYYGQPGEGVVFVLVDERSKASVERILASMKRK